MMKSTRFNMLTLAFLLALVSVPAYALFAKLSTELVAQYSLDGQISKGKAAINQAGYPSKPGVLKISVSGVNVPDGTLLSVNMNDCPWFGPVAYLKVTGKGASLSTALPASCQIGRTSTITVNTANNAILLKGGAPWKI